MSFTSPAQNIVELDLLSGMTVADVGAGVGHYALEAARIVGETGAVFAIDIQDDLLSRLAREAQEKKLPVTTIVSDLEQPRGTTLKDESVDAAILATTLFQIEKKLHVLSEIFRILKPGGPLLFVEWNGSYGGVGPADAHIVSEGDAREMLDECGLLLERRVSAGEHHYALIVRKR